MEFSQYGITEATSLVRIEYYTHSINQMYYKQVIQDQIKYGDFFFVDFFNEPTKIKFLDHYDNHRKRKIAQQIC